MSYRDEHEGLRARIQTLEQELASARETIARLQGESVAREVAQNEPSRLFGMPTRFDVQRELPVELTDKGYEAAAEVMQQRLGHFRGQMAQVGRALTYRAGGCEIRMDVHDGKTRVRATMDHRNTAGLIVATFGATILGMLPTAGFLKGVGAHPSSVLIALPIVMVIAFFLMRALIARAMKRQRADVLGVVESIIELGAKHAARARVATAAPDVVEQEFEAEARSDESARHR